MIEKKRNKLFRGSMIAYTFYFSKQIQHFIGDEVDEKSLLVLLVSTVLINRITETIGSNLIVFRF